MLDRIENDPTGKNPFVGMIRRTVNVLCAQDPSSTVQQERDYTHRLCEAVAANLSQQSTFNLLGPKSSKLGHSPLEPSRRESIPKEDHDQDLLAAAALVGNDFIVRDLLDRGVPAQPGSDFFGYALTNAAKRGDELMVRLLLDHGSDINDTRHGDCSALMAAATAGHEGVTRLLLDSRPEINTSDRSYRDAVLRAAHCGYGGLVRLLLERDTHEDLLDLEYEILRSAATSGHEDLVRMMQQRGVSVDRHRPRFICDPALLGAIKNGHASIVRLLLQENTGRKVCNMPVDKLAEAAQYGHQEVAQFFLDCGVHIGDSRIRHSPPLVRAARANRIPMMQFLIARGANLDEYGERALREASTTGAESAVRWLLEHGVDPNGGKRGRCAIHSAMANEEHHVVRILLAYGAQRLSPTDPGYAENFADGQHPIPPLLPPSPAYDAEHPWANY